MLVPVSGNQIHLLLIVFIYITTAMSHVATAYLQAELKDDCDEMEIEDVREQRALGAFAFLFSPEDTMVECQDCKKPVCLDIAIPSETVCAFRCEKCDVQHVTNKQVERTCATA